MVRAKLFYRLFIFQFDLFQEYSIDMENLIRAQSTSQLERMQKLAEEYSLEEQDEFWEYNMDRVNQLTVDYPNLLRSSILTSVITELEDTIVKIHKDLQDNSNLEIVSIGNKQLSGSTIERALQSIHQVIPLSELYESSNWKDLQLLLAIRNRVVHSRGVVHPVDYKELFDKLKYFEKIDTRTFRLDTYHQLLFLENSSDFIINTCKLLLDSVVKIILVYTEAKRNL
ncbi:hypothetical protein [Paenibacillus sp. OK076]|uniref:hypothetical protein n=1 Tax=Paenibacillus sp. OK076 TaxID=1884379 RepID=UPI0008C813E2|nr:hypothetical protein [Paenibacillus sp. OK076]SEM74704.1 hypothetical protein SAMN05518670_0109 [Paenibacillus sp. OK076]